MQVSLANEAVTVTGGVRPYEIATDTTGNIMMVTVVDFDGCTSTTEFTLSSSTVEVPDGIKIYPNPSSTQIYIDFTGSDSSSQMEGLQIVSINGQLLQVYGKNNRIIDISALNEGVYILQIELAGGAQINKRVLILR
jgi:hypothetical protein